MKKRTIEKYICLAVVLMSVTGFSWGFIDSYLAWKETGINVLRANARGLAAIAGLGVLFGSAFWALRVKERQAPDHGNRQVVENDPPRSQRPQ